MSTTQHPEALRDARWYMVNKDGMATLCTDREDAEKEAEDAQIVWPHMGPHRAVQLVEAADVEALRAGYAAARLEIESLRGRSPIPPNSGEYPALPEPDTRWRAQFAGHGVSFHSEDQIIGFANERASAAVDADRAMRAAQPIDAMLGEQAELRRLSDCCPELNLSNYGPDDVDELNGWAIEVSQCIDRALAAQPAGAQQPDTAYAELPSYEHQRAIMEAERNASLDEYSRIVPLTSTESMIYERAFTNGWNRNASHGQAPAQPAPQQAELDAVAGQDVMAWMTQEGDRVVTARTMGAARRGGGAMLSSLRDYSVALVRANVDAAMAAQGGK